MRKTISAYPLYKFLRECNSNPLQKIVLDCGAGGKDPPLQLFYEFGYETYGIDISKSNLNEAMNYGQEHQMSFTLLCADMRSIPFRDEMFSFMYSYNTIQMMSKNDVKRAISEMQRVLKSHGLCFVNFVSMDEPQPPGTREIGKGEFLREGKKWCGGEVIDSYFEDEEPDILFQNCKIIHKEKRAIERELNGNRMFQAYIDYIVEKR